MAGFNPFMFGNPAGVGQMTAAGQTIVMRAGSNGGGVRRKRKATRKRASKARRASPAKRASRRGKAPRLVKGSAATKAYMAKIRRKRRK